MSYFFAKLQSTVWWILALTTKNRRQWHGSARVPLCFGDLIGYGTEDTAYLFYFKDTKASFSNDTIKVIILTIETSYENNENLTIMSETWSLTLLTWSFSKLYTV